MPNTPRHFRIVTALVALLALGPAQARAQCPPGSWNGNPITTPALDQTLYFDFFGSLQPWGSLHLDQVAGQGSLSMAGGIRFTEICAGVPFATMNAADDYVLTGPVAGTPTAFSAVWHLSGTISGGIVNLPTLPPFCSGGAGDWSGTCSVGLQTVTRHYPGCPNSLVVSEDLELPLSVTVGSHFSLTTQTHVQGDCDGHGASLGWQLRFVGLPPGYKVVSCWGFQADGPTPTRQTSWGVLKQYYR